MSTASAQSDQRDLYFPTVVFVLQYGGRGQSYVKDVNIFLCNKY